MTREQHFVAMLKKCKRVKWKVTVMAGIRTVKRSQCPLQIYTGLRYAYREQAGRMGMTWSWTNLVIHASDKWTVKNKTRREAGAKLRKRMLRAFGLKEIQKGWKG